MEKNYPSPPFTEAYIIQLPQVVKDDASLNWTDRIAYWFFTHHKGDTAKVLDELALTERHFRKIKNRLASRGHIAQIEERGQVKYIPIDLRTAYWLKIDKFRKASTQGFQRVPDHNIFSLEKFHSTAHILHCMEVLEWTYRKSKQAIKNPYHMLARSCKTGVTPAADFSAGFWESDDPQHAPAAANPKKTAQQEHKDAKAGEADARRALALDRKITALSFTDQKMFRELAMKEIRANGGLPKFGAEKIITMKMRELVEKNGGIHA